MKVRVAYSVEVDDDYRRAINAHYGRDGLATREEVRAWIKTFGTSEDDNLAWSMNDANEDTIADAFTPPDPFSRGKR